MSFFRHIRAAYSAASVGIPPKFELIPVFVVVLVTCKNEEDQIKNEGARVLTRFSQLYAYRNFSESESLLNVTVISQTQHTIFLLIDHENGIILSLRLPSNLILY